jgi:hypothetical protein
MKYIFYLLFSLLAVVSGTLPGSSTSCNCTTVMVTLNSTSFLGEPFKPLTAYIQDKD